MIGKLLRTLLGAAIDGIQRFPLTALAVVIAAIIANLDIADWIGSESFDRQKIYPALAAFAAASLMKQIGAESWGMSRWLQYLAALFAGVFFALVVWFAREAGLNHFALFAGLVGAVVVAAHWFRGTSAAFWFYVIKLVFAFALAMIAVIVFALGLSAIFASLDYLFGVDVGDNIYGHIWATSLIAGGPLFALGRIPDEFDLLPEIDGNNYGIAGLRLLSDFLAAPMLAIYALILHAYALKIVITGEVPQNQIGWMVIGYGTLIIFFWKLMLPLRQVLTQSGRLFLRVWPFLVMVPMALLFYALWLRIGQYGITPDRYFLVVFGLLMTLFALMQFVPALRDWLPGAAPLTVLALIVGSLGPWGAEWVSVSSQTSHFVKLLDEKSKVIAGKGNRAGNIIRFLARHDALRALEGVVKDPQGNPFKPVDGDTKWKLQARLEKAFEVSAAKDEKQNRNFNLAAKLVSVKGFDLFHSDFSFYPKAKTQLQADLKAIASTNAIYIIRAGIETRFSLQPLQDSMAGKSSVADAQVIVLSSGDKKLALVPRYLNFKSGSKKELQSGTGSLFLRSSDWQ